MTDFEEQKIREDLKGQMYEACRKLLVSNGQMLTSATPWARDAFYTETMRNLAMISQQVGDWRLCIAKLQQAKVKAPRTIVTQESYEGF